MTPQFDIAIITVIRPELSAMLDVLGFSDDQSQKDQISGTNTWHGCVRSVTSKRDYQVVLACIGGAGNPGSAALATELITKWRPRVALLVGIAAGIRGKVRIGDVVLSDRIVSYEPAALTVTSDGTRSTVRRPEIDRVTSWMQQEVVSYRPDPKRVAALFRRSGGKFPAPLPGQEGDWSKLVAAEIHVRDGTIASGEKLLRDKDVLPELRQQVHGKIDAGEMEAAGFVEACRRQQVHWLVVRGISDFGDTFKDDRFHDFAARTAAAVTADFIRHRLNLVESSSAVAPGAALRDGSPPAVPSWRWVMVLVTVALFVVAGSLLIWWLVRDQPTSPSEMSPPVLTSEVRERAAQLDKEAMEIWRHEYDLVHARNRTGKAPYTKEEDDELLGLRARRQRLKARMGQLVFAGRRFFVFDQARQILFFEERPSAYWRLTRIEELIVQRSNELPFVPRVFDYNDLEPKENALNSPGSDILFSIHPPDTTRRHQILTRTTIGAPKPYDYQVERTKTDAGESAPALAARWIGLELDWIQQNGGKLVIETEDARESDRCIRMLSQFGTEESGRVVKPSTVEVFISAEGSVERPRFGYDVLRARADFLPQPDSFHLVDEAKSCGPYISGEAWQAARDRTLGDKANQIHAEGGWHCVIELAEPDEGDSSLMPMFLIYVQPRAPGCFTVEESMRAVRRALGGAARDGGVGG